MSGTRMSVWSRRALWGGVTLLFFLVLGSLPAAAQVVVEPPPLPVDPDAEELFENAFVVLRDGARETAQEVIPYVLNLFLAFVFFDLILLLYRTQILPDTYWERFWWRVGIHIILFHFIEWSVSPNPLPGIAGTDGWGYAVIDWSHELGTTIANGGLGGGLRVVGLFKELAIFYAALAAKFTMVQVAAPFVSTFFGGFVFLMFWGTVLAFVALLVWIGYVAIDAIFAAYFGIFVLPFVGFEPTAGIASTYPTMLIQRGLQVVLAYVMIRLGLILLDDHLNPFIISMNPLNVMGWVGMFTVVFLYVFFAVWRLPRMVNQTFGNASVRLESLLNI